MGKSGTGKTSHKTNITMNNPHQDEIPMIFIPINSFTKNKEYDESIHAIISKANLPNQKPVNHKALLDNTSPKRLT